MKALNAIFVDVFLTILVSLVCVLALAVTLMNPPTQQKGPERKAEFLIDMSWPDMSLDDIDLWVQLPSGEVVSFKNRDVSGVSLDRDDLGITNDLFTKEDGTTGYLRVNRETVAIRTLNPGRYNVNVQVYSTRQSHGAMVGEPPLPYPVTVKLTKVNPNVMDLVTRQVVMERMSQQKTAFSFTVTTTGDVTDVDNEQIPFIPIGYR